MAAWAVLHFNIALQMTTTAPGTQTVFRTAKSHAENAPRRSPEIQGKLILQIYHNYALIGPNKNIKL